MSLAETDAPQAEGPLAPLVPRRASARDRVLPIFIVASLIVHATIMLPSLLRDSADRVAPPPKEVPVEVVQDMPKPAPKPPATKPPAQKAAEKPKPPAPKPQKVAQREAAPRHQQQKPPAPKPQIQKVAAKAEPPQQNVEERMKQLLGGMPAIALPSNTAVGSDEVSYAQLVLSKLAKAKKEGRYEHPPGVAGVDFTLGDAGEVTTVEIIRSSGDKWIDDEAIAMVKRGAPYPPPPPGARRDFTITLRLQSVI